jgi:hypothetical protein
VEGLRRLEASKATLWEEWLPATCLTLPGPSSRSACAGCRKDCHQEETGLLMSGAANHAARLRAKEMHSIAE